MSTAQAPWRRPAHASGRPPIRPLLLIGTAGTVLRVVYTLTLARHVDVGVGDASFYHGAANHLAWGNGYVDIWRSLVQGADLRTAHHPPGWPALLSVFSWLGVESVLGHRLVGAVLGGIIVVLLGLLGWCVGGRGVAIAAAGLGAIHPTLIASDASLMSETLAGGFVVVILLVGLRTATTPTVLGALSLGVAIGSGALVRGEAVLYVVLVAAPVAVIAGRSRPDATRGSLIVGVAAVVGAGAVVLPWTVRNTLLFDEPVLISTNDSTVLAGANCDPAYEGPGIGSWQIDCIADHGGTEVEDAAAWRADGIQYARDNAGRLPVVVAARVARTWGVFEAFPAEAEGRHPGTQTLGSILWLAFFLPGALVGAVMLARRRRLLVLGLLLAPVVAATVVSILGFGMLRFRHPMELSAVVLTAVAVVRPHDVWTATSPIWAVST